MSNHLKGQTSPYLMEHVDDPVDWYPWSEEAFAEAGRSRKPIFLSIGYSTCHWCHVMQSESFKDPDTAKALNDTFVCIKVDREERPDIDRTYMSVCQMMTGRGGWPLTIFMTPNKKPFFAASYLPKENRYGLIGLRELVGRIKDYIAEHGLDDLESFGDSVMDDLAKQGENAEPGEMRREAVEDAFSELEEAFDDRYGGFGIAPKFPMPTYLLFLINHANCVGSVGALRIVTSTLRSMGRGGIYDQVGFGFFRYSTDREWLLPHFEKMLYDQALLAMVYTRAYKLTNDAGFAGIAKQTLELARRELGRDDHMFSTAIDADTEGGEGAFYLWDYGELEKLLGKADMAIASRLFGFSEGGNIGGQSAEMSGKNLPYSGAAERMGPETAADMERIRKLLFEARESRQKPRVDDKVLADMNGLMLMALAEAYTTFGDAAYLERARAQAGALMERMVVDGTLYHSYAKGKLGAMGFLDDYAFVAMGLVELYEASFEAEHLRTAIRLADDMVRKFWDEDEHCFMYGESGRSDVPRAKELYDGVLPSGNAAAFGLMYTLDKLTGNAKYIGKVNGLLSVYGPRMEKNSTDYTHLLMWFETSISRPYEVVIAGRKGAPDTEALLRAASQGYMPNRVVLLKSEGIEDLAPFTKDMKMENGKATAYVCTNFACKEPTTEPGEVSRLLGSA